MEWIEAKLYTTSEAIEIVTAMLLEAGINGLEIHDDADMQHFLQTNQNQWDYVDEELLTKDAEEVYVVFYVSNNAAGNENMLAVRAGIERLTHMELTADLGRLALETAQVDDKDWIDNWKKYYKPFPVGEKLIIKPTWESYENTDDKIILQLNPGHVFGTGLHQSTQLCLERLEQMVTNTSLVVDLGCGSGVLSIAALLLGAKEAVAVDIDPNAVDIAYENASFNHVPKESYHVYAGNILDDERLAAIVSEQKYDLAVVNIVADVVIAFSPFIAQLLAQDGHFIASGIITERLEDVYAGLACAGFVVEDTYFKDGWVCVVSRRA